MQDPSRMTAHIIQWTRIVRASRLQTISCLEILAIQYSLNTDFYNERVGYLIPD